MDKEKVLDYVMHTPHNTNRAVLSSMLNQLTESSGGGSSDFSTAEVTVSVGDDCGEINGYIITVDEEYGTEPYSIYNGFNETLTVPLYKGKSFGFIYLGMVHVDIAVTGDIVVESNDEYYITGDGTITITKSE